MRVTAPVSLLTFCLFSLCHGGHSSPLDLGKSSSNQHVSVQYPSKLFSGQHDRSHSDSDANVVLTSGDDEHADVFMLLVGPGTACLIVLGCLVLSSCCSQHARHSGVPEAAGKEMRDGHIWGDQERLAEYCQEHLQAETYAERGCWKLFLNRPWKQQHHTPGDALPPIPDWSPNKEWLGNQHFPNGERQRENFLRMVKAFWIFVYRHKKPHFSVFLSLVCGICPAASAQLLGLIVDEITPAGSQQTLLILCASMLAVQLVQDRANYLFEIDVPLAGVRWELRCRLHREFLAMGGEKAYLWPAGRCTAVVNYDVNQSVGLVWASFFTLIRNTMNLAAVTALMLYTDHDAQKALIASSATFLILILGCWANIHSRRKNCLDLCKRKRDWEQAWLEVASAQLSDARAGPVSADHSDSLRNMTAATLNFTNRNTHYFFTRLVAVTASSEVTYVAQAAIAFVAGTSAMNGKMTTGQALALVSAVKLLAGVLQGFVDIELDLLEGYASLLSIERVFNHHEVQDAPTGTSEVELIEAFEP